MVAKSPLGVKDDHMQWVSRLRATTQVRSIFQDEPQIPREYAGNLNEVNATIQAKGDEDGIDTSGGCGR